jgi:hypothetical protein
MADKPPNVLLLSEERGGHVAVFELGRRRKTAAPPP